MDVDLLTFFWGGRLGEGDSFNTAIEEKEEKNNYANIFHEVISMDFR